MYMYLCQMYVQIQLRLHLLNRIFFMFARFTEEKAFTPRTLKTHKNVQSRLSSLKCYRPPPKKQSTSGPVKSSGPVMTRPETPMTADSVDLMNETLMSRDLSKGSARTPTGVPPLDISMDADHIHWLKV